MKLHSIETGHFKLDGGAMFGVVPKSIWQKTNPADSNNLIDMAMRCLLVEDGKRLTLIDTGIGNKQSEKFFSHYYLHGSDSLDSSLKKLGFHRNDITDVFLTHLHFDHCGGAIEMDKASGQFRSAFPNAHYWTNERHWKWATQPNPREKASFLTENILPILTPLGFEVLFVDGHTDSMMLPVISIGGRKVCYMADLLPSIGHIPLAYVMGYDTRPLITLEEKARILKQAVAEDWILFYEHDPMNECSSLVQTDKGPRVGEVFALSQAF
jgi:glyoxylase-like metal-dependent hydrolase (beta-lactamase superfamily II)